ncbi:MAG: hypothetical protein JWO37_3759 [Acidimicrobiales bacterium]|jgi:AcrR family transcriptional regulator|nr:hypothetical protein [Acidimicrobiales bacterium]
MAATDVRPMDRAKTEQALKSAALAQLGREGVLAGLNLRKVADEAGVNRGLVYHYFGSRRDLLRSALRDELREQQASISPAYRLPLKERVKAFLRIMSGHDRLVRLTTLLLLDGSQDRTVLLAQAARDAYESDREDGVLADDVDVDALHVALVAAVFGYTLHRRSFARELGVPPKELDERMGKMLERLVGGLEGSLAS